MLKGSAVRTRSSRLTATALLVGTLGMSGALAWLGVRAASSQRRSVATALRNYADIAAWQYARAGRSGLTLALAESQSFITRDFLRPVRGTRGTFSLVAPAKMPGPEILRRLLGADPCLCVSSKNARLAFRITPDRALVWDGDSLDENARHALVAAALGDSAVWSRRGARLLPPGVIGARDEFVVLFRIRLPAPGQLEGPPTRAAGPPPLEPISAVYGMVIGAEPIQRVLRQALSDAQVLAPSLVARLSDTTLVHIAVASHAGQTVFGSAPAGLSGYVSSDTIGDAYGGLTVHVALDEGMASEVLLSRSMSPSAGAIGVLLALTLALGIGALVLLRREQLLVQLRQDFVSGVSHELRTPLTQIRLHSELILADGFHTAGERRRALEVVHRESLRMTNLVDNVLRFGRRGGAATTRLDVTPVSLGAVATEVREMFQPIAAEAGASLSLDPGDAIITADRDAVTRILCNLVENALKYGPRGQAVRIGVVGSPTPSLTVEDGGPGIPAPERDRIWEPFYRLGRDRNASRGGSGLGLSVVAELVASLGGTYRVEDGPGGGARFIVSFPA